MPKLSVVIPVYNAEKYLNQCIDSVLGQTFSDFELILVDDGSKDRSGAICDTYAYTDPRVRVIHTKNQGVVTARRTGVNLARGQYTTCMDSDDWIDLDYYHCIFESVGKVDADVFVCAFVNRGGKIVENTCLRYGYYDKEAMEHAVFPQMIYNIKTERFTIEPNLWSKFFRTDSLRTVYEKADPTVTLGEDAICTYLYLAQAASMYIVENYACYHYREDHISMVNHCDIQLLQRVYALATNMEEQFSECSSVFGTQIQGYIAYIGLRAARQVLLLNRELCLSIRIRAVKKFFAQPVFVKSFRYVYKADCSDKIKWKSYFAAKNHPCLLLLLYICNLVRCKLL